MYMPTDRYAKTLQIINIKNILLIGDLKCFVINCNLNKLIQKLFFNYIFKSKKLHNKMIF